MASRAMTVGEVIDQRPIGRYQFWTIILCALVLVMDGYDALTMGYVATPVAQAIHTPVHSLGPILSASLFGLMIAALGTGPIADRVGRKWVVIISELTFALFAILTGRASTYHEFLTYRFLTGLGLGGAMPNVVAIASEYSPKRLLPAIVSSLFVGMPLGGMICGLVSWAVLGTWGWQWVFYIGGIAPLIMALALIVILPESVRFLVGRDKDPRRAEKILARVVPGIDVTQVNFATLEDPRSSKGVPVKHLFTEGRALGTILLWIPYFMNLLLLYFLTSWLPSLLKDAGMSTRQGVLATTVVNLGGIFACFAEGPLLDAGGAFAVLITEFLLVSACMVVVGIFTRPFGLALAAALALGFLVIGAQAGLNAMSAKFYPTPIRSTGVGWALGIGRVGSVIGPLLGGWLQGIGWKPREIIISGAVCGLCGWLAILLSKQVRGVATAYTPDSEPTPLQLQH